MVQRSDLASRKTVLVIVPENVAATHDHLPNLRRLARVVEEAVALRSQCSVAIVLGGAKRLGRHALRAQETLANIAGTGDAGAAATTAALAPPDDAALAAAGHTSLVTLYRELFTQMGMLMSEVVVSDGDVAGESPMYARTVQSLLQRGVVAVILANEAAGATMSASDLGLAVASACKIPTVVWLAAQHEVFDKDPSRSSDARALPSYSYGNFVRSAELLASTKRIRSAGVDALVVVCADEKEYLRKIMKGEPMGTLFT